MTTIRDLAYDLLRRHGGATIFGNPCSNEMPFLQDFPSDFRYVLALHEGAAIGVADGYAQATGQPRSCQPELRHGNRLRNGRLNALDR